MWGVQFRRANNSLICGSAEFEVRYHGKRSEIYRVSFGPHDGMTIATPTDDGWKIVKRRAEPEDIEAILPQGDYMHKWTYGDFIIAMTFFDEGHKMGYNQGRWDTRHEPAALAAALGQEQEGE